MGGTVFSAGVYAPLGAGVPVAGASGAAGLAFFPAAVAGTTFSTDSSTISIAYTALFEFQFNFTKK